MDAFPHHYRVGFATAPADDTVLLASPGLATLACAPPVEFGGPGGQWSPETLLVGAIASCFALSFESVATASKFAWKALRCEVVGTLERQERVTRFTAVSINAELEIDDPGATERAVRLLHKAEEICLVTSSLSAAVSFQAQVKAL